MNDVGRIGRRLIARSAHAGMAGGRRLGEAVLERRRPKLRAASVRLALPRFVARRPSVSVGPPAPPGMTDFAAAWLFGDGPAEGTPFAAGASIPRGERPSFLPPAPGAATAAAPRPAASPPPTGARPRSVVEEFAPFRLSRTPATGPDPVPPRAAGAAPETPPERVPPAAADVATKDASAPAAAPAAPSPPAVAADEPAATPPSSPEPVAAPSPRSPAPSRPAPVVLRTAARSPASPPRPRLHRRAVPSPDPVPVSVPAPANVALPVPGEDSPTTPPAAPAHPRRLWRRLLGLPDSPAAVSPRTQPEPPATASVPGSAAAPPPAAPAPMSVARSPAPAAADALADPEPAVAPEPADLTPELEPAPTAAPEAFVTLTDPALPPAGSSLPAPGSIQRAPVAAVVARRSVPPGREPVAAVAAVARSVARGRPAPAPVRMLARTRASLPTPSSPSTARPAARADARRMAAVTGAELSDQGGVASVVFAPDAVAPAGRAVLARAEADAPPGPSAAPVPAAAAGHTGGSAHAGHSPAAPDMTEVYEHVVEQLRRELLVERERMGDLTGDLP